MKLQKFRVLAQPSSSPRQARRRSPRALTIPAIWIAPPNSNSFPSMSFYRHRVSNDRECASGINRWTHKILYPSGAFHLCAENIRIESQFRNPFLRKPVFGLCHSESISMGERQNRQTILPKGYSIEFFRICAFACFHKSIFEKGFPLAWLSSATFTNDFCLPCCQAIFWHNPKQMRQFFAPVYPGSTATDWIIAVRPDLLQWDSLPDFWAPLSYLHSSTTLVLPTCLVGLWL